MHPIIDFFLPAPSRRRRLSPSRVLRPNPTVEPVLPSPVSSRIPTPVPFSSFLEEVVNKVHFYRRHPDPDDPSDDAVSRIFPILDDDGTILFDTPGPVPTAPSSPLPPPPPSPCPLPHLPARYTGDWKDFITRTPHASSAFAACVLFGTPVVPTTFPYVAYSPAGFVLHNDASSSVVMMAVAFTQPAPLYFAL
jgi:hypothetical protein